MACQHDQINIKAFSQAKHLWDNIASQDCSMSHHTFRPAASDGLFEVVHSILLREVKESTRG
jgi:hypothetical protein